MTQLKDVHHEMIVPFTLGNLLTVTRVKPTLPQLYVLQPTEANWQNNLSNSYYQQIHTRDTHIKSHPETNSILNSVSATNI